MNTATARYTEEEIAAMPSAVFLRYCMERLGFLTDSGDFDMQRAARFWGIRYELFVSMAAGRTPLLKREREKIKKKMDLTTGVRIMGKRDAKSINDLQNERMGRYLRNLREKLFLVGIDGISKNQAQIAALMEVSVGAVQTWEYGRTRIPDARLEQYLQIVGADSDQARKAYVMLGIMPATIQEGLASENPEALELWDALVTVCNKSTAVEVAPQQEE
jgi:DNA-binding transcriptional regulator YiaG